MSKDYQPKPVLVVYDTQFITIMNERSQPELYGSRPAYAPAKYALSLSEERTDDNVFANVKLHYDKYMNDAIWFHCQRDIPTAITLLKEKFPDVTIGDEIEYIIDFPDYRRNIEPGGTIVTPVSPEVVGVIQEDD
jgi:hypothetical protein